MSKHAKTYRTISISDVHLGTNDSKAEQLNNFLKHNTCETLYLVGDIIDAWKIQQNTRPKANHLHPNGPWYRFNTTVILHTAGLLR
jgi:UDP-2,3-diacylglucosamine pyrophosphatase LpxH